MTTLLDGKVAVVTGGASGNGRAIALAFASHGADVIVADIRENPRMGGVPTHEKIQQITECTACFQQCDVSNEADVEDAIDLADEFGGVDIMVNNAGIRGPNDELVDTDLEAYRRVVEINQHGVMYGSKFAASRMRNQGYGSIINISSVAGIEGYPNTSPYGMTKGAIRLLTYSLALELGPDGIRVNAIHPGVIRTSMTIKDGDSIGTEVGKRIQKTIPLQRFGEPEEVADTAVFLASDMASYISGESIIVDGGVVNTAAHAVGIGKSD